MYAITGICSEMTSEAPGGRHFCFEGVRDIADHTYVAKFSLRFLRIGYRMSISPKQIGLFAKYQRPHLTATYWDAAGESL